MTFNNKKVQVHTEENLAVAPSEFWSSWQRTRSMVLNGIETALYPRLRSIYLTLSQQILRGQLSLLHYGTPGHVILSLHLLLQVIELLLRVNHFPIIEDTDGCAPFAIHE